MRIIAFVVLFTLSATAAEARYVRVWVWQPDRLIYRSWELGQEERAAVRWARHCRIMYRALHYLPYGCR